MQVQEFEKQVSNALDLARPEKDLRYYIEIERDNREAYGPGMLYLIDRDGAPDGEVIFSCPVITGPKDKLNPKKLSNITPPISWCMVEKICKRDHPHSGRKPMTMARIYPVYEEEMDEYGDRTYKLTGQSYPFMIHLAGSTTGCIAILKQWFEKAVTMLNQCWEKNGGSLEIFIFDVN